MRYAKRKWGWWFVLLTRQNFKLKLLWFGKGQKLSKQYHKYRSELWLSLKGSGWMQVEDNDTYFHKGNFFLINAGQIHKYHATKPSLILEVQFGTRCSESDIVRLD